MEPLIIQQIETPLGAFRAATSADAVAAAAFETCDRFDERCQTWRDANPDAPPACPKFARHTAEKLEAYFEGDVNALNGLPIDPVLPQPTLNALRAVQQIPPGETRAYSDIARQLNYGRLGARFVGSANARNPIALFIPCHRVIAKDGTLGGYGGQIHRKAWLLEWERTNANNPNESG